MLYKDNLIHVSNVHVIKQKMKLHFPTLFEPLTEPPNQIIIYVLVLKLSPTSYRKHFAYFNSNLIYQTC